MDAMRPARGRQIDDYSINYIKAEAQADTVILGDIMNPSNRPGAIAVIMLFMAGAAIVLPAPDARADVEVVSVVDMMNNTVMVDLFIDGDIARVNVTREYTINESKGIDEVFDTGLNASGSSMTAASLEAPKWGNLSRAGNGLNITFNTSFGGNSSILVDYSYSLEFHNVGALNFSRIIRCRDEINRMYTIMELSISDLTFLLHSNIPVTVDDGVQGKTGTDIKFNYSNGNNHPWWWYSSIENDHHLVSWNTSAPTARVNETVFSRLTAERHVLMDNLIESEFVNITVGPGWNGLSYSLDGEFNLNSSVLWEFAPVWLWFPNNISSAEARIYWEQCEIQESVRDGQKGFYILMNDHYGHSPKLVVNITGNITDPWCDFFIVTIPAENSSIRYILPDTAKITGYGSPYEWADFENTSANRILDFHGRCLDRGPVHIEWDPEYMYPCLLNASYSNVTCESATLAWETTSNPQFVRYEICRSNQSGEAGAACAILGQQQARQYALTGLEPNTTCYFTIRKVLAPSRTVVSEQMEVQTLPDPPRPCKVTVVRLEENASTAIVTWTPSASRDFSCNRIFCSSTKGILGERITCIHDQSTTEYNMTRLDPNRSYFITVMTVTNRSGESYSDQVELAPAKITKTTSTAPESATNSSMVGISLLALVALFIIVLIASRKAK